MAIREHRVTLVLTDDLAAKVEELAMVCHVWAIRSPKMETVARHIWDQHDSGGDWLERGVTVFNPAGDSAEEQCISILATIQEHHGALSHDPPLSVMEVMAAPTEQVKNELASFGFLRVEPSAEGFVAFRGR